jgi:integrase
MAENESSTRGSLREPDPSNEFYVYHLLDGAGTPFWVGCTKHPGRYAQHLRLARCDLARNSHVEKNEIIIRMLDAGLEPGFVKVYEGLSQEDGWALERAEIARLGRLCLGTGSLANTHDGGPADGGVRPPEIEARRVAARRATFASRREAVVSRDETLEDRLNEYRDRLAAQEARRVAARAATLASRREEAARFKEIRRAEREARRALNPPKVHKPRQSNRLTARTVDTAKPGRYCDGQGLWLIVSPSGFKKYIFRFTIAGRVTEMGIGGRGTTLAQARDNARAARNLVASGVNPIESRREALRAKASKLTFGQCADALIAAKSPEWRNEKHRRQWRTTLETYAGPLWAMPVDEVSTEAVLAVLTPLWQRTPETAARLRGRIEAVLDAARAKGHIARNEANPARWRGHLDKLLPKRQKLTRGHHAAMAFDDVPEFLRALRERASIAALALEFLILTAARSGEVFGARWAEIDLEAKVWTIPAARMKAGREHRVPLSGQALAILEEISAARTGEFVFPGQQHGKPLSPMAMGHVLRRMKVEGMTIHGLRSSFRDWCGEATSFSREIAEAALAHVSGDATERAYRRGDALEKRRTLMEAWAAYCDPKPGNVVSIGSKKVI